MVKGGGIALAFGVLESIDTMIFDKIGTQTEGNAKFQNISELGDAYAAMALNSVSVIANSLVTNR